jgi:hypothetical protein
MRLASVGNVLATRTLELSTARGQRTVHVFLGVPRQIPECEDYYCPYQIVGLSDEGVRYAEGVDEAQAIYLAMEAVGTRLSDTDEAKHGRLTWYGEPFHGFPQRSKRPHLRLVASSS